ncbi:uncharacterized protein TRIVIDRAFT_285, partial [Trichoderma virens Gv29-8]
NGRPHEKVDDEVAQRLNQIFEQPSPNDQQIQHNYDTNTTWFGVEKRNSESVFHSSRRLLDILHESQVGVFKERFPHLVSFIGHTGAGKSTVIKMLMDRAQAQAKLPKDHINLKPVPGLVDDNLPTTGDVHLYADPATYYDQSPILFADSEGMTGGENTPRGIEFCSTDDSESAKKARNLVKDRIIKRLSWGNEPKKNSREFAVKSLFPRILYTFSDVIVFVLREARIFEDVLHLLVEWAAVSISKSVNQPSRPHVIIVLNAAEMTTDDRQWEPEFATDKLLEDYKDSVNNVPYLQNICSSLKLSRSIKTTKDLLNYYYLSVTVLKIPRKGHYMQIDAQLIKLYDNISSKCAESHDIKKRTRMLLNAERLPRYVNAAYDHFTQDLDEPFDFVTEARRDLSPPQDFGGHVLNFILFMYDQWETTGIPMSGLFYRLAEPIASCVMLAATRDKTQGTFSSLLQDTYKAPLSDAVSEFCDKWLRCSFKKDGNSCVNTKLSHEKGHQTRKGVIFARGGYQSSFNYLESFDQWIADIQKVIESLEAKVNSAEKDECSFIPRMHRSVMETFYYKVPSASRFRSHLTCVCCIGKIPENILPCGHIICKACVKCFGDCKGQGLVNLYRCPLHPTTSNWHSPIQIEYKPEEAGVRVLCLDGYIVTLFLALVILREIEMELGDHLPIQSFFDLIVGTSAGGILALGLGVKNWPVSECTSQFKGLCKQAFTKRAPRLFNTFTAITGKGLYRSKAIESALRSAFGNNSLLYGRALHTRSTSIRVAVTTTLAREDRAAVLSNYNTECRSEKLPYVFIRPQDPTQELKVWEAARATSAAPPYFKPFIQGETMRAYTDGAIHHHCPVFIADQERRLLWEDVKDWPPDIVLSIGSGFRTAEDSSSPPETMEISTSDGFFNRRPRPRRAVAGLGYLWRTANKIIEKQLDCEEIWRSYSSQNKSAGDKMRYGDENRNIRLNVHFANELPALDDVKAMDGMEHLAKLMVQETRREIQKVAEKLIASCFYFETVGPAFRNTETGRFQCKGRIHCRFHDVRDIQGLGKILLRYCSQRFVPSFLIKENYGSRLQKYYKESFSITTIENMASRGIFTPLREISIEAIDLSSQTNICLCLHSDNSHVYGVSQELFTTPLEISGFPRNL